MEIGALPRDAERSRAAILDAAERLFAERGPHGATLQQIGTVAGLSRATPSYFFGSKTALHAAVLDRVFAARDAAVAAAFAPVHAWTRGEDERPLPAVLDDAVGGYVAFLVERPAFVRLLAWEALDGGGALAAVRGRAATPTAIADALVALREVAPAHGLARFDVSDALLVLVSLTFSPVSQQATFLRTLGVDLRDPPARRRLVRLAVEQLLAVLARPAAGS